MQVSRNRFVLDDLIGCLDVMTQFLAMSFRGQINHMAKTAYAVSPAVLGAPRLIVERKTKQRRNDICSPNLVPGIEVDVT